MYILSSEQMRTAEALCVEREGIDFLKLMERAGRGCAEVIREKYKFKTAVIVCGKGKNGGDGFVIARELAGEKCRTAVLLACGEPSAEDAATEFERLDKSRIPVTVPDKVKDLDGLFRSADIIVECLYGTGFRGRLSDELIPIAEAMNNSGTPIISVDVPAGINCDTARTEGVAVKAHTTLAISALKNIHVIKPANEFCGEVYGIDIGITDEEHIKAGGGLISFTQAEEITDMLPQRPSVSHKGTFGNLLCVCGSMNMPGAAVLSAKGAVRMGAGLVTSAFPDKAYPAVSSKLTEPLMLPLPSDENGFISKDSAPVLIEKARKATAILIGCGMGCSEDSAEVIRAVLKSSDCPVVLDADALNCLARFPDILDILPAQTVITPHPGEMSRLTGKEIEYVTKKPIETAHNFAKEHGITVVLKGANTIVCSPGKPIFVNSTGNHALARGGSGDLLAGMIASLLAQKPTPFEAAVSGVFLHGFAADRLKGSRRCSTPSDIADNLPNLLEMI